MVVAAAQGTALIDFIGYGSRDPLVVFLGIEEKDAGGGGCAIRVRETQFQPVEDLLHGCTLLAQCPGFVNPFAPGAATVPQWNTASRFRLALAELPWAHAWNRHWRMHLGRNQQLGTVEGDTLLMECFADPATGGKVARDRERRWPERRLVLRRFIATTQPRFVIAYGAAPGQYVGELFPVVDSVYEGIRRQWHPLGTLRPASIGRTASNTVLARVAFFGTGQFNLDDLGPIASGMATLAGGPAPLRHVWP
jgi:hypothetical protein